MEEKNLNNEESGEKIKKSHKINLILLVVIIIIAISVGIVLSILINIIRENITFDLPNFKSDSSAYTSSGVAIPMKPIIYIYPEEEIDLTIKLENKQNITCSYPKYEDAWKVKASPDGTLVDLNTNRKLYALYWEGKNMPIKEEYSEGFCIKGEETAKFLEEKLEVLGLNYKEAQEFIVYWLPKLENNKYNYIRFASIEEINEYMPLEISKEPDTLIRILMQYKPLDEYKKVKEQKIESPKREGFTVVEWGGTEIKDNINIVE